MVSDRGTLEKSSIRIAASGRMSVRSLLEDEDLVTGQRKVQRPERYLELSLNEIAIILSY
jgi:hypothetical protein